MKDNNGWIKQPKIITELTWKVIEIGKNLYLGSLPITYPQYKSNLFVGLTLNPTHDKELKHDLRDSFPLKDSCIKLIQSEDTFEHIEYDKLPTILNDIYRILKPGGLFRLSLPDYNCSLLRDRSVYDSEGNWLCDLAVGGSVSATFNSKVQVTLTKDGDSHQWAPTFDSVTKLINNSELKKCCEITPHQYWINKKEFALYPFDQSTMPVQRTPPKDMRANGAPVSIVVDFVK